MAFFIEWKFKITASTQLWFYSYPADCTHTRLPLSIRHDVLLLSSFTVQFWPLNHSLSPIYTHMHRPKMYTDVYRTHSCTHTHTGGWMAFICRVSLQAGLARNSTLQCQHYTGACGFCQLRVILAWKVKHTQNAPRQKAATCKILFYFSGPQLRRPGTVELTFVTFCINSRSPRSRWLLFENKRYCSLERRPLWVKFYLGYETYVYSFL